MSRDPFEYMKNNNPVPDGTEPSAPMSMAERIVGARAGRWPAWALTAVTAAAVLVVGLGSVWLLGGDGGDDVAAGGTTSSVSSETTVTPTTHYVTTTVGPEAGFEAVVYFLADGVNDTARSGPYLIPVAVEIADQNMVAGTMQALLDGPPVDVPAISSAIPDGTSFDTGEGPPYADGIVNINLTSEFESGGGSLSMTARLAQVVFSLTRIDGVDGVRFFVDGAPLTMLGGEGVIVPDPMTREDIYPGIGNAWDAGPDSGLVPAVLIESPAFRGTNRAGWQPPRPGIIDATGIANVFEATVSLALTDDDGLIIWEGFTTASCGTGCWGAWDFEIPYDVDEPQMGALIAWESSAMDGSQTNVREHPVWLVPTDETPDTTTTSMVGGICSGALVTDPLIDQPDLPAAVTATRSAIFAAATTCDWDALEALLPSAFTYSFGGGDDPIGFWRSLEFDGEDADPLYHLAELLNRPFGTQPGPDEQSYYAWPSAFVTEWSLVAESDREALRPLYGDEDFAVYEEFGGYIGYRVGILTDGTWVYFVAGD